MKDQNPQPQKTQPPTPKIGDKRPTPNPHYKETVTGYDKNGPVWRSAR
jgi:hypothetical protein